MEQVRQKKYRTGDLKVRLEGKDWKGWGGLLPPASSPGATDWHSHPPECQRKVLLLPCALGLGTLTTHTHADGWQQL